MIAKNDGKKSSRSPESIDNEKAKDLAVNEILGEMPEPPPVEDDIWDMGDDPDDIRSDEESFQRTYGHGGFFPIEKSIARKLGDIRLPFSMNYRVNRFFQKANECGDIRSCFLAISEFRKSRDKENVIMYTLWLCMSFTKSAQKKGFRSLMTRELYEIPPQNELLWSVLFDINKFPHPNILQMLKNGGFWSSKLGADSQPTFYDRPRLGTHYFVAVCDIIPKVETHNGRPYIWVQHHIAPFWKKIKKTERYLKLKKKKKK